MALGIEHLRVLIKQCCVTRAPFRGMKLCICINDLLHGYDKDGKVDNRQSGDMLSGWRHSRTNALDSSGYHAKEVADHR